MTLASAPHALPLRSNGEDEAAAADASKQAPGSSTNCLKLSLKPQGTGAYPARLLLSSPYDVRVVMVELTAQSAGAQFALELECAARQSIVQVRCTMMQAFKAERKQWVEGIESMVWSIQ